VMDAHVFPRNSLCPSGQAISRIASYPWFTQVS
jgi:hypothetical protein